MSVHKAGLPEMPPEKFLQLLPGALRPRYARSVGGHTKALGRSLGQAAALVN